MTYNIAISRIYVTLNKMKCGKIRSVYGNRPKHALKDNNPFVIKLYVTVACAYKTKKLADAVGTHCGNIKLNLQFSEKKTVKKINKKLKILHFALFQNVGFSKKILKKNYSLKSLLLPAAVATCGLLASNSVVQCVGGRQSDDTGEDERTGGARDREERDEEQPVEHQGHATPFGRLCFGIGWPFPIMLKYIHIFFK